MSWRVDDRYTVALLHGDIGGLIDEIDTNSWGGNGDVGADATQSKFGGASLKFDGTGDFLEANDNPNWQLDGGSNSNLWTIDFWIRFNGDPGTTLNGLIQQRADNNNRWIFYFESNLLRFAVVSAGSVIVSIDNAWNPAGNTWYYISFVKQGTTGYKAFVDGTQVGTTQTDTDPIPNFSGTLDIGRIQNSIGTSFYLNGWLDDVRISKGIARLTANSSAPTRPCMPMIPVQVN